MAAFRACAGASDAPCHRSACRWRGSARAPPPARRVTGAALGALSLLHKAQDYQQRADFEPKPSLSITAAVCAQL